MAYPSSCGACGLAAAGDRINVNPKPGPLQDNGDATWTHALLFGSPAIDAGTDSGCPATDQRGVAWPQDGDASNVTVCNIGAYEGTPIRRVLLPIVMR